MSVFSCSCTLSTMGAAGSADVVVVLVRVLADLDVAETEAVSGTGAGSIWVSEGAGCSSVTGRTSSKLFWVFVLLRCALPRVPDDFFGIDNLSHSPASTSHIH